MVFKLQTDSVKIVSRWVRRVKFQNNVIPQQRCFWYVCFVSNAIFLSTRGSLSFILTWGQLSRCIPFYLHMDEGTSLRKSAILVLTVQTLFGADTLDRLQKLMQQTDRTMESMRRVMTQAMNHSAAGSTYKSRFLFTAIPKKWYSRLNSNVYTGMLQKIADECVELFNSGISIFGHKYYMICLGLKADQPAQAKAGNFTRSFANLGQNKGCCFECLAGLNAYPFEEVNSQPAWLATLHAQLSWNQPSPLVQIPHKPFQSETFSSRVHFTSLNKQWEGTLLHHASSWWWTYNSTLKPPTTVLRTSLTDCMLISISGWNTSGGVTSVPTSSVSQGRSYTFPTILLFLLAVSRAVTLCCWFVGWNTWWTMDAFSRTTSRGLVYPCLDGANLILSWCVWCPMLALVSWYSFICYIHLGFGCSQIRQAEWPRVVLPFALTTGSWLLRLSGYSFAVSISNHLCIISSISTLSWGLLQGRF